MITNEDIIAEGDDSLIGTNTYIPIPVLKQMYMALGFDIDVTVR